MPALSFLNKPERKDNDPLKQIVECLGRKTLVRDEQDAVAHGHQVGVDVEHRRQDLAFAGLRVGPCHRIGNPVGVHPRYRRRPQKKREWEAQ